MIKILVIDDDLVDQMAIKRMIDQISTDHQYLVQVADSVAVAKTTLEQEDFNCIICDYNLGDGTVLDLLDALANKNWVLLTGDNTNILPATSLLNQCQLKLHKDFHLQYLTELVQYIESLVIAPLTQNSTPTPSDKISVVSRLLQSFDHNETIVKELIDIFIQQNPIDMKALEIAFKKKELATIKNIAHRIKSGLALLGFPDIAKIASSIERTATDSNAIDQKLKLLFNELKAKTQLAYLELQNFEK